MYPLSMKPPIGRVYVSAAEKNANTLPLILSHLYRVLVSALRTDYRSRPLAPRRSHDRRAMETMAEWPSPTPPIAHPAAIAAWNTHRGHISYDTVRKERAKTVENKTINHYLMLTSRK